MVEVLIRIKVINADPLQQGLIIPLNLRQWPTQCGNNVLLYKNLYDFLLVWSQSLCLQNNGLHGCWDNICSLFSSTVIIAVNIHTLKQTRGRLNPPWLSLPKRGGGVKRPLIPPSLGRRQVQGVSKSLSLLLRPESNLLAQTGDIFFFWLGHFCQTPG